MEVSIWIVQSFFNWNQYTILLAFNTCTQPRTLSVSSGHRNALMWPGVRKECRVDTRTHSCGRVLKIFKLEIRAFFTILKFRSTCKISEHLTYSLAVLGSYFFKICKWRLYFITPLQGKFLWRKNQSQNSFKSPMQFAFSFKRGVNVADAWYMYIPSMIYIIIFLPIN